MNFYPIYTCNWAVSVPSSSEPVELSKIKLRCLLVWAICSHRLSEIEAIRFEGSEELELFSKHAKHLTSLKKVAVGSFWDGVWTELQSFITAYSACHGGDTKRLLFEFGQGPELTDTVVETMSFFNPPPLPRVIKGHNLPLCAAHHQQMDFSRVRGMIVEHSAYAEKADLWSQVLPKCTILRDLEMRGFRSERRIFRWAVQERRAGRSLAPLKAVKFKFCNFIVYPTVNDLLEGFGPTLESVKVKCGWDGHWLTTPFDKAQPWIAPGLHLPSLRTLEARVFSPYVFAFNPDRMPTMPRLEVLKLDHAVIQNLEYSGLMTQYDMNTDRAFPLKTWPICEFPQLRVLCLTGRSAAEFNPQCFQSMSRLEELTMVLDTGSWAECWPAALWTWDWELPSLKKVALGQLMASAFRFEALCHMPNLESVILGGIEDRDADFHAIFDLPITLNDESDSEDNSDGENKDKDDRDSGSGRAHSTSGANGNSNGMGGGVLNGSVTSIEVGCSEVTIGCSVWRKLLSAKAFPSLRIVYIGGYVGAYDAAIVREASRHPGLRELWISKPEQLEHDWPVDLIDGAWETGGGRTDEDGHLLFHVNHECYRVPKEIPLDGLNI
ncbi:hypothetical protein DFQ27_000039 [Actinomortierella ambigua]|uniref:Uncharacterized protein n=1 Tax=Actinomortierella ambigua TaxID=1343610 RepID=A0A9P6QM73_9FUNG|nr:hypothetical protein DFQ27_000039 [Actinomortierella ambigua]